MEHKREVENLWQLKLEMNRKQMEEIQEEKKRVREEEAYQQEVVNMAKE